jgi:hypothetical protein
MHVIVEPRDGHEIDRLITALLNATGMVHQILDLVDRPELDGVEVIGVAAERIRDALVMLVEGRSDADLAIVTGVLAEITLRVAADLSR